MGTEEVHTRAGIRARAARRRSVASVASVAAGVLVLAGLVAIVVGHRDVREFEAWLSAGLVRNLGIVAADQLGTAVIFPLDRSLAGFTISAGCSVAFLLPPFYLVAAGLVASGRIAVRRGLLTIVAVTAALVVVNQIRLLVVAASMRGWGFNTGYERSHILLGTLVSTIGVVVGVVLFCYVLTRQRASVAIGG